MKIGKWAALVVATLGIPLLGVIALAGPSQATDGPHVVVSKCYTDWYTNPDEASLLPVQKDDGFLFDGPSLVHHPAAYTLSTVPTDGDFDADVMTGVKPLFKMETSVSYSTINKTTAGKYWSSKIVTGDGSQGSPVDSPANLIGKWSGYTADTKVISFGVGYANDTGNKALVKKIKFGGQWYNLNCKPKPSASASASASPKPSASASASVKPSASAIMTPTSSASPTGSSSLPVTGPPTWGIALAGGALLLAGAFAYLKFRPRKMKFTA